MSIKGFTYNTISPNGNEYENFLQIKCIIRYFLVLFGIIRYYFVLFGIIRYYSTLRVTAENVQLFSNCYYFVPEN